MAINSGTISKSHIIEARYNRVDIGGSDLATETSDEGWVQLGASQDFQALVTVDTFNAADTLDTLQIEEAKDINGLGGQLLTGKAVVLLAGDVIPGATYILEAKVGDLTALYGYVRLVAAENDDTGVNEITVTYTRTKGSGNLTEPSARV